MDDFLWSLSMNPTWLTLLLPFPAMKGNNELTIHFVVFDPIVVAAVMQMRDRLGGKMLNALQFRNALLHARGRKLDYILKVETYEGLVDPISSSSKL